MGTVLKKVLWVGGRNGERSLSKSVEATQRKHNRNLYFASGFAVLLLFISWSHQARIKDQKIEVQEIQVQNDTIDLRRSKKERKNTMPRSSLYML